MPDTNSANHTNDLTPTELEAFRRLLFFSVPEAAKSIAGVSEQAWRRWEGGSRKIPSDVGDKVVEILSWRNRTYSRLRQAIEKSSDKEVYPLLWYQAPEDWVGKEGGDVVYWRAYQSVCAVLADEFKGRVKLTPQ